MRIPLDYAVLKYGNDALRVKARRVGEDEDVRGLADDMLRAMHAHSGLGLASTQIGRDESICVIDIPPMDPPPEDGARLPLPEMPLVLINPRIISLSGEQAGPEGCLSFPELFLTIRRAMEVEVEYRQLEGGTVVLQADGLLSRAIQHELDHLAGVLLVDRMSPAQKVSVAGKLRRLRKANA